MNKLYELNIIENTNFKEFTFDVSCGLAFRVVPSITYVWNSYGVKFSSGCAICTVVHYYCGVL